MWRLRREKKLPWHAMETWGVQVGTERVGISPDVTVAEIRKRLPAELLPEFEECVSTTSLRYLGVLLSEWALPPEKLLAYRREMAKTYYRSAAADVNVEVPDDLDVNEIMRTRGGCLLGTREVFLPVEET